MLTDDPGRYARVCVEYPFGMRTTERVTVTLPVEQVQRLRQLAGEGDAASISAYVSKADQGVVLVVPAASLAQAQARLAPADLEVLETLVDLPVTVVVDLTRAEARQVAAMLAKAGKSDCLAAGHAAWTARRQGMPVLTSDPTLLRALATDIEIDELP